MLNPVSQSVIQLLTDNMKIDFCTCLGLGAHLTLIPALINGLHIFDLQGPRGVLLMFVLCLESLIGNESGLIHGYYMTVFLSHPGHGFIRDMLNL